MEILAWSSVVSIHRIKPAALPSLLKTPGKHPDGAGLYLQVARAGAASWTYQCSFRGQVKWMSIGPAATFTLAEAREEHHRLRRLRDRGIDPTTEARRNGHAVPVEVHSRHVVSASAPISLTNGRSRQEPTKATGLTFGEAVLAYIEEKSQAWKGGAKGATVRQWKTSLVDRGGTLAPLLLHQITPDVVQAFLDPLSPVQKKRVRTQIASVTEYMRTGVVKKALPPIKHFAALPYAEVPALMMTLAATEGPAARILAFTILTAARIGEVVGDKNGKAALTWKEINGNMWTVPAARMKKGREHRVPLSAAALALLGPHGADDDSVFPVGITPTYKLAKRLAPKATIHGFRSSFKVWSQETNAADDKLSEAALSHYEGGTYAAYARGDMFERRRELMDKWAAFCMGACRDRAHQRDQKSN